MQRLTVLMYHRVLPAADALFPDVLDSQAFAQQLALCKRVFQFLPLAEALARLRQGNLPRLCACITFDDGYADNAEVALPVLRGFGIPATFFISTGFLGGGCMWNDRVIEAIRCARDADIDLSDFGLGRQRITDAVSRRGLIDRLLESLKYLPMDERLDKAMQLESMVGNRPAQLMMSEAQVRQLRDDGMQIGAHTVNHPILSRLDAAAAQREISQSKEQLEAILNERVGLFAYPNGRPQRDYGPEHVSMVRRAGFEFAVSTAQGVATPTSDLFQVPRIQPWPRTALRLGLELMRNLSKPNAEIA